MIIDNSVILLAVLVCTLVAAIVGAAFYFTRPSEGKVKVPETPCPDNGDKPECFAHGDLVLDFSACRLNGDKLYVPMLYYDKYYPGRIIGDDYFPSRTRRVSKRISVKDYPVLKDATKIIPNVVEVCDIYGERYLAATCMSAATDLSKLIKARITF